MKRCVDCGEHPFRIMDEDLSFSGEEVEDGIIATGNQIILDIGNDGDFADYLKRGLRIDFKSSDRFDRIAEEVDSHREVGAKAEDIYDTASYAELTGFSDEVDAIEFVGMEQVGDKGDGDLFVGFKEEGILVEVFFGD